jgi:hypothetical protein
MLAAALSSVSSMRLTLTLTLTLSLSLSVTLTLSLSGQTGRSTPQRHHLGRMAGAAHGVFDPDPDPYHNHNLPRNHNPNATLTRNLT